MSPKRDVKEQYDEAHAWLKSRLTEAREQRDGALSGAQAAFDEAQRKSELVYQDAVLPCRELGEQLRVLRAEIARLIAEAERAQEDVLRPARRCFREARVAAGKQFDESCAQSRRFHEARLRDARTDLRRSGWRIEMVDGAGECLLSCLTGELWMEHGPEHVDETHVIGLVTEQFVKSMGWRPLVDRPEEQGLGWWDWTLGLGDDAEPMFAEQLVDEWDDLGPLPEEYIDWVIRRTRDALEADEGAPELCRDPNAWNVETTS